MRHGLTPSKIMIEPFPNVCELKLWGSAQYFSEDSEMVFSQDLFNLIFTV